MIHMRSDSDIMNSSKGWAAELMLDTLATQTDTVRKCDNQSQHDIQQYAIRFGSIAQVLARRNFKYTSIS